MVNLADLFQLWGEFVGIDVHQADPHIIDSQSMLPYLTNPQQPEIRQVNFTQTQSNIHINNEAPPPCVVQSTPPVCAQLFTSKKLCEFEGGIWYGPGGDRGVYPDCCAVKAANLYGGLELLPDAQYATRNDTYKLVRLKKNLCNGQPDPDAFFNQFYSIDERPIFPKIDNPRGALCDDTAGQASRACPIALTNQEERDNYSSLSTAMTDILMSQPDCPGDGNEDLVVNQEDLTNWAFYANYNGHVGGSSWYDFDFDGVTGPKDRDVIEQHMGIDCRTQRREHAQK
jgi:hypothetical protein